MNYRLIILVALVLTLAVPATAKPDDSQDIQGTWLPTQAEIGGKGMTDDFLKNTVLKLDNGKYEVTVANVPDKGNYAINPKMNPKTLDIAGIDGPNAGKKIPAIYELHGDTLRICYGLGDSPRPTEFKSSPGTQNFLVTYQRKKSK
jgi:uncharacterized protein (TIGR03067 family)